MNVKSYLFDFDGTFVDTAPGLIDAANRLFKKHGKDFLPFDQGRAISSDGTYAFLRQRFNESNENFVSLITTESKERSELTNYYDSYQPDSSMYFCPLTNDPYLISVSDDKSGIRVASPITDMYKERRYLIFSFKAGNHGYINDGVRSWD